MSWKPYRLVNEALRFLLDQRSWLVRFARRKLNKYRLPDFAEDVVQISAIKCLAISDKRWSGIKNKEAYLATIIRNEVNDLYEKYRETNQPLSDWIKPCTPIDAMVAGCLVQQILQKLSREENELLELYFEGHSRDEIAHILQITPPAARKRLERLRKKLRLLIDESGDQE